MIERIAPAKINLYLHVGPVRNDGLHDLASLFVFAEGGDRLVAKPSPGFLLDTHGPFASLLADLPQEKNIVFKAAIALNQHADVDVGAALSLEKNLPVAAGIGGGSADAAAALLALCDLWKLEISQDDLENLAFLLGADVPACLRASPIYVSGAGEILEIGAIPENLFVCLVNPLIDMPTGPIFKAFDHQNPNPPAPEKPILDANHKTAFVEALKTTRNDLEPIAIEKAPVIGDVVKFLGDQNGALLSRMSGSGATCFGLFDSAADAQVASATAKRKNWWAMASPLRMR